MDNDRVKSYLLCGAAGFLLAALLFVAFKTGQKYPLKLDSAGIKTDSVVVIQYDTITQFKPVPVHTAPRGYEMVKAGTLAQLRERISELESQPDTAAMEIPLPIEEKTYRDSLYSAQVSGISPRLDWIEVYPQTKVITREVQIPVPSPQRWKRIGWGVSAGPGVFWQPGMDNVTPGVGIVVGLRVNL